ncbi:MAG TPA: 3-hydroxyacyl-CoA dehydrogenase family protein [Galbitalea sp.]|jgi:3-hydroxybutyryl-CoA dehydrogenase|nr:3-hydroxyacyl-CoA dehydrogenase family protein [Galbitalea sp.]
MSEVPTRVGVLGGGRMGAGIAHAFLVAGSSLAVVERNETEADGALKRVVAAAQTSIDRGTVTETLEQFTDRLDVGIDDALFDECDLVIEAVPEDLDLKVASLRRIESRVGAETPIASNTSSISIDDLAATMQFPARLLGLHFFNPVPASELVEIVVGAQTEPGIVKAAQGWVNALDKTPVTVRNSPGFASSRLGLAIGLEAIRMLEEGVASASDIDAAMVLGYKFPVGPLRLTDIVGLDVRLGIAEYLHSQLGERFAPPQLLRDKVAAGELGRKSGRGFFDWSAE